MCSLICFLELCPTQRNKKLRKKGREEKAKSQQLRRQRRRITKIEEETKHREARIAKLETELILAKEEAEKVKHTSQQLENSLQFTQKEQEEVLERINECQRKQAAHDNDIIKQEIYSRRWNIIFYKIPERREENIVNELKMVPSEVESSSQHRRRPPETCPSFKEKCLGSC